MATKAEGCGGLIAHTVNGKRNLGRCAGVFVWSDVWMWPTLFRFGLEVKNSEGRRCGYRVKMWGTSSLHVKLTGDFDNASAAGRIGDCFPPRTLAKNKSLCNFRLCNTIGPTRTSGDVSFCAAFGRIADIPSSGRRVQRAVDTPTPDPQLRATIGHFCELRSKIARVMQVLG